MTLNIIFNVILTIMQCSGLYEMNVDVDLVGPTRIKIGDYIFLYVGTNKGTYMYWSSRRDTRIQKSVLKSTTL